MSFLVIENNYKRINNVLFENGMPIILFYQNFIDADPISDSGVDYLNRYMEMNPSLFECLKTDKMKNIVKLFYKLETTGLDYRRNGIHRIVGIIEVNGSIKEEFDLKVEPYPGCVLDAGALSYCGLTADDLDLYPEFAFVHSKLSNILLKYCDPYDSKDKIWLVGFNNRNFDDLFFRTWFEKVNTVFFGSVFWPDTLDVLVLASQYLIDRRSTMPSFKLHRVAKELGIVLTDEKNTVWNVELIREIYRIVTGLEIEI